MKPLKDNCRPKYFRGRLNLIERILELQGMLSPESADKLQDKLTLVRGLKRRGYSTLTLVCLGGQITYYQDLEKAVLHQEQVCACDAAQQYEAWETIHWISCKELPAVDLAGRTIYETPFGVQFTVDIQPGSPEHFGAVNVLPPYFGDM